MVPRALGGCLGVRGTGQAATEGASSRPITSHTRRHAPCPRVLRDACVAHGPCAGRWSRGGRRLWPCILPHVPFFTVPPPPRDALERKGPHRRPPAAVRQAVGGGCRGGWGGYCRLQMPLRLALGVRGTVAGHRLGALEGGGTSPPFQCIPAPPPPQPPLQTKTPAFGGSRPYPCAIHTLTPRGMPPIPRPPPDHWRLLRDHRS